MKLPSSGVWERTLDKVKAQTSKMECAEIKRSEKYQVQERLARR